MLKRQDIAVIDHIDGRAILELKPGYQDLGIESEIDLGVAGSDEARQRGEEVFAVIRRELQRRKVKDAVERAQRLAVGTGLIVTVAEIGVPRS
jgi:hypothetical protein